MFEKEYLKGAFPIPEKELLSRYEQLYTGAVNDVLRVLFLGTGIAGKDKVIA
jgi:hypothetical protein